MLGTIALLSVFASKTAEAQVGHPFIHDPSTIVFCDGKYYTFGTGGGGLISADGWHWESGAVRPGGGAAPDALKIGDRYLIAICQDNELGLFQKMPFNTGVHIQFPCFS